MQLLENISVKMRMVLAFALIVVMLVIFGVYTLTQMNKLGGLTETLYNHPLRVSNAALAAQSGIIRMHRDMKDVTLSTNEFELLEAIRRVQVEEVDVYKQLDIVQTYILGEEGHHLAEEARKVFADWKPIRIRVETLIHQGKRTEAAKITKGEGADHVQILKDKMEELTQYARSKADGFIENAREVQREIRSGTLLTLILGGVLILGLAFMITRNMSKKLGDLQESVSRITETGELEEIQTSGVYEIANLAASFNDLIQSLKQQFWLREGLNKLNDEVAKSESLYETCEMSINFISRHMDACSGAFYIHDKESKGNDLFASYALIERSYLSNHFDDGEGVVGQVAREKKAIRLSDVNREEALMVSGTTSAIPAELAALPLIYRDNLLGVIEIASLVPLDETKMEFLQEAVLIIATAVNTTIQRERIDTLYEDTKVTNKLLEQRGEELNFANEQLEARNDQLNAQSMELQAQAEELQSQTEELIVQKTELETKKVQLEEADRLKSEFLSNMSHELRTPLNSILALSQLMMSKGTGCDIDKEAEYLNVIERNGKHLLSLINDILDLSKIESGRMDLFVTEFRPADLVQDVVQTMMPLAEEKGLDVRLDLNCERVVTSDRDKISQIALNLLSNAVKFTETGSIDIKLACDLKELKLSVADTGIGIESKDLSNVFDEFRQVDGSTTRRHEGTGLGLAICKKLAILLGGDLYADSELGKGSIFSLFIPLKVTEATTPTDAPDTTKAAPWTGARETILVVDDEPDARMLIGGYLKQAGYNVLEASSGKAALKIAQTTPLLAITLDILMPEMDGWETLRQLKLSEKTRDIPVIIISVGNDMETGTALGASGYIVKPVEYSRLMGEMKRIIATRVVETILIVDDDETLRRQMTTTLEESGYFVVEAEDGEEALKQARLFNPDIVLLDLMMPRVDGFQVIERMAAEEQLKDTPIIVVTAKDLSAEEKALLYKRSQSVIQKGGMSIDNLLMRLGNELKKIRVSERSPGVLPNNPSVLVVEDNEIAAMQISTTLEEINCTVQRAHDGDEAIKSVQYDVPDLIILDLMMPGINGFEVLESIRSTASTSQIPVVVLSAKELTSEDRARLSSNNVRQLIKKGTLDREHLKSLVLNAMSLSPEVDAVKPSSKGDGTVSLASGQEKTLLVVEDNEDNITTIQAVLDDFPGRMEFAHDGEEAIDKVRQIEPDMILMDIQLPGISGLDATRYIKKNSLYASIPIIALTARAMKEDRGEILEAGCDDLLTKPYDPEQLRAIVAKWLSSEGEEDGS